MGLAYGQTLLTGDYKRANDHTANEQYIEAYYRWQLHKRFALMGDFQWIKNAGGDSEASDIYIFGLRSQIDFWHKWRKAMKKVCLIFLVSVLILATVSTSFAMFMGKMPNKKAIVLADFGTTYLSALKAITTIQSEVKKDFPNVEVRMAFTSNIIRNIWHKRRNDAAFMKEHGKELKEFLNIKGPLATIADLQDEGYRTIIVQPCHIYSGEEYTDLCSYVNGLNTIKTIKVKYMPFVKLVIGRPALGTYGPVHDYHKDMHLAAKALKVDVELAKKDHAALVYMGHGNEYYSTGIYAEFQQVMRRVYPGVEIFIGTVEGFPSLEDVVAALKQAKVKRVVLKPLMIVAGDHANNDMAGPDRDSWKNTIKRLGIHVIPIIHGLGENHAWARIYVQHIKDAIKDNHVKF